MICLGVCRQDHTVSFSPPIAEAGSPAVGLWVEDRQDDLPGRVGEDEETGALREAELREPCSA